MMARWVEGLLGLLLIAVWLSSCVGEKEPMTIEEQEALWGF